MISKFSKRGELILLPMNQKRHANSKIEIITTGFITVYCNSPLVNRSHFGEKDKHCESIEMFTP